MSKGAKVTINIGEGDAIKHSQLDLTRPLHWMQTGAVGQHKQKVHLDGGVVLTPLCG